MKDKVILITGGSGGIGLALARKFLREGSKVAISGRGEEKLKNAQEGLSGYGDKLFIVQGDVSEKEDCRKMVEDTVQNFGKLDVLINNAGISMRAPFIDTDPEVINKVMDINFRGTVYCTPFAISHIVKSKGTVAGISSIAGFRGLPGRTGYSSSKFAMNGFLEALRTEMIPHGVHVLTAAPGFTESDIRKNALLASGEKQGKSPLNEKKIMSAEEVADKIYAAVRKRKRTIIMTTQGKLTVFLNKCLPSFMDKMVLNHFKKEEDSPFSEN